MEAENLANTVTEALEDLRRSRSRSNTPFSKANGGKITEKRSDSLRGKQKTAGPVTSTPIDSPAASNNGLTAISESYSETVTYQKSAASGKSTITVNSETKTRRSGRPKVVAATNPKVAAATNPLTNGGVKKSKDASSGSISSTVSATKKKTSASVKERELYKTSDYSSDEEERNRTIKAYRTAGEWWNTFPKTDYTYSPASECRTREVAPGVLPVPNMSRRSLASLRGNEAPFVSSYAHSSHSVAQSSRSVASEAQSRWFQPTLGERIPRKLREADWASADSDVDEVEEAVRASRVEHHESSASYFTTFFVAVWTVVTTTWTKCVETTRMLLGRQNDATPYGYSTPTRRTSAAQRSGWSRALDRLYVMCARVRLLDNWFLAWMNPGSGTVDRTNRGSRTRLLVWLLLLPFLLFCGFYLTQIDSFDYSIPFPTSFNSSVTFVKSSLTSTQSAIINFSSAIYEYLAYLALTLWAATLYVGTSVYEFLGCGALAIWNGAVYVGSFLYSFLAYIALHIYEFVMYVSLTIYGFFSHLPSTFIEFFAPLYNVFSPMFDLQLTLPNIY